MKNLHVTVSNIYIYDAFDGSTSSQYQIILYIRWARIYNTLGGPFSTDDGYTSYDTYGTYQWDGSAYDFYGGTTGWIYGSATSVNTITRPQNGHEQVEVCISIARDWFPAQYEVCQGWYSYVYNTQYWGISPTTYYFSNFHGGIDIEITFVT